MNVTIIYPAGQFGSEITEIFELEVPHNPTDAHTEILETVFREMNHVDGSEDQLISFGCRSMSVGDYCEIEGIIYYCASLGWAKTDYSPEALLVG